MIIIIWILALMATYGYLGGAIKYLDGIQDTQNVLLVSAKIKGFLVFSIILLVDIWAFFDFHTAILALALLIGLTLTQKVDTVPFVIIGVATLPIILYSLLHVDFLSFTLPLLLLLAPAIILDELFHAFAPRIKHLTLRWLAEHRIVFKVIILVPPLLGLFSIFYSIAFWCFDITYELIDYRLRARLPDS
jgi:hypothetical protein